MTLLDVERIGPYLIQPEEHVAAAHFDSDRGIRLPARQFKYVIRRRADRSLVYRTETFFEARDIVARILEPGVLSR
jgi:hypothetical protein